MIENSKHTIFFGNQVLAMIKLKFTVIVMVFSILALAGLCQPVLADTWIDGTPYFYEQTIRLAGSLGYGSRSMMAPPATSKPAYVVGDQKTFYANDMRKESQYLLKATLRAVSDKAYIFVENGRSVATSKINSLLSSFNKTYDILVGKYGPPPDSIDGDPRIYILILEEYFPGKSHLLLVFL